MTNRKRSIGYLAAATAAISLIAMPSPASAASKLSVRASAPAGGDTLALSASGPARSRITLTAAVKDGRKWLRGKRLGTVRLSSRGRGTRTVKIADVRAARDACSRGRLYIRASAKSGKRKLAAQRNVQRAACSIGSQGPPGTVPTNEALGLPPSPPYPAAGKLRWAPPPLTNPETVQAGSGFTELKLNRSKDYIVVMPSSTKLGGTSIDGGRNVVIVGGHLTVPPQLLPTADADRQRRALYVKDTAGTVHIEGLLIDGSGGGQSDGIAISAPDAIVQVQNTRIVGLRGGESTWHADLIQPWGGVKELRVDRLTGSSTYQGLHIAPDLKPIGGSTLSRVNLSSAEGPLDRGGYMLWMTRGSDSVRGDSDVPQ